MEKTRQKKKIRWRCKTVEEWEEVNSVQRDNEPSKGCKNAWVEHLKRDMEPKKVFFYRVTAWIKGKCFRSRFQKSMKTQKGKNYKLCMPRKMSRMKPHWRSSSTFVSEKKLNGKLKKLNKQRSQRHDEK